MFGWFKRRRRDAIRRRPFPDAWPAIIEKNVPYAAALPPADRAELRGHIQVFLAEKHFEGCDGLTITDEIRVTIAAQACVLLLHRRDRLLPASRVDPRVSVGLSGAGRSRHAGRNTCRCAAGPSG